MIRCEECGRRIRAERELGPPVCEFCASKLGREQTERQQKGAPPPASAYRDVRLAPQRVGESP